MINMLRADFYRMTKGKSIYIALAIIFLLIGVDVYLTSPGTIGMTFYLNSNQTSNTPVGISEEEMNQFSISEMRKAMLSQEDYKLDLDIMSHNINLYYVFLIIIVFSLTTDFSQKSIKNTLSSAISRKRYYLSKTGFILITGSFLFFLSNYAAYFLNLIFNKKISSSFLEVTKVSFLQLPVILLILSFLTCLAFLLKKKALFNAITIPFIIITQTVLSVLQNFFSIKKYISNYEIECALYNLAQSPSTKYISEILCISIFGILLLHFIGYASFRKLEIK